MRYSSWSRPDATVSAARSPQGLRHARVLGETGSPAIWRSPVLAGQRKIGKTSRSTRRGYQSNGVVFARQLARQMLFSGSAIAWRRYANGRPQMLFTTPEMDLLLNELWPAGRSATC